jgi:hypothetical protein
MRTGRSAQRTQRSPLAVSATPRTTRLATVLLALTLLLAAALLLVPNAQARLVFPPAQPVSPAGQDASGAEVAVDSNGRATVIWSIFHGPIQAVRLGADGSPGALQDLGVGDGPQLAVDPPGRATVVWGPLAGPAPIRWRRISAEGISGETRALPADGRTPRVAVDSQGRATVVWQGSDEAALVERIHSLRLGADGTPGPVHALSPELEQAELPDVTVDPQGGATVVWQLGLPGGRVEAVHIAPDGTPGPVHILSNLGATRAQNAQVAVDRRGRATVVWEQRAGRRKTVQAVRLGPDGNPGAVHKLSKRSDAGGAQVAVDLKGRATVVWQSLARGNRRIQSVRLGADGNPGAVKTISRAQAYRPQVAVDSQGRATVVWERFWERKRGAGTVGIQARRLGGDGSPGAVHTLSRGHQDAYDAQIAVDPTGRPTVVWQQSPFDGDPEYRIQSTRGRDRS